MNALETMKKSLKELQGKQADCVSDCGYVKCRYRYQLLTEQIADLKST
jgi:hypothetical protein